MPHYQFQQPGKLPTDFTEADEQRMAQMDEAKTALELAAIAIGRIDAHYEKESMDRARQDIRTIASLFEIDAETLWLKAFRHWYQIAKTAYDKSNAP